MLESMEDEDSAEGVEGDSATSDAAASAISGRDLLVISQTGSGKTLIFLLPLLQQLTASAEPATAVVLAPTAALAAQHAAVARELAADLQAPPIIESLGEGGSSAARNWGRLLIGTPEGWLERTCQERAAGGPRAMAPVRARRFGVSASGI